MPTTPPSTQAPAPVPTETSAMPPRRKLSRRASLIGTVIALVVAAGLAWLAWDLTRPEQQSPGARGAGGPGGGGGGGRGGPGGGRNAVTVGFATAEAADIPINLD